MESVISDIVLWDEPFTNLDDESGVSLASIIEEESRNTTVLFTSPNHDSPFNDFTSQLMIENGLVQKKSAESLNTGFFQTL